MKTIWINYFSDKNSEKQSIRKTMSTNILFKDLNTRDLMILEKIIHIRKYSAGEYVFRQDKPGAGMFIIVKGRIIIQKEIINIDEKSEDEILENTTVTTLEQDDFFGEISLVESNSTRTASAKAVLPSTLIGFFKPDLLDIMRTHPVIGMKILYRMTQVLSRRLIETNSLLNKCNEGS